MTISSILLYLLLTCLVLTSILWSFFSIPIRLKLNTTGKKYSLAFPGGEIRYTESGNQKGFLIAAFTKRWFISTREILVSVTKLFVSGKKKEEKEKPEKKTDNKPGINYLKLYKQERQLFNTILKSLTKLLKKILNAIKIKYMTGSFSLKDPYYNGLCYAILAPFCRHNIKIVPNFENLYFFRTDIYLIPTRVILLMAAFIICLPWQGIYRVWRENRNQWSSNGDMME
ncbi:MAG: hypothetical protein LWY06_04815 [Firmicutes bacterium]|nr:hypothetical protein [Bacillota bacterium]